MLALSLGFAVLLILFGGMTGAKALLVLLFAVLLIAKGLIAFILFAPSHILLWTILIGTIITLATQLIVNGCNVKSAGAIIGTMFIFIWLEYVHRMSEGILKFLYVAVMLGIIVAVMMYMEIYLGLSLFILGIIFLVYEKAIGKYTVSGQRKMEYIEGLKMYFETAEKNKIDKFETEEEELNYFNRIFPYIIALKVEDEKIGIFKDSLDFLNIMGSYAEAQCYVNEYVDRKFPIFRKKYIFW